MILVDSEFKLSTTSGASVTVKSSQQPVPSTEVSYLIPLTLEIIFNVLSYQMNSIDSKASTVDDRRSDSTVILDAGRYPPSKLAAGGALPCR